MPRGGAKGGRPRGGGVAKTGPGKLKKSAQKSDHIRDGSAAGEDSQEVSVAELESRKQEAEMKLNEVEDQIFKLETQYLEQANLLGNALKGYDGLLTAPTQKKVRDPSKPIRPEERVFSRSSYTGSLKL